MLEGAASTEPTRPRPKGFLVPVGTMGKRDLVESPEPAGISLQVRGTRLGRLLPDPIMRRPCADREEKRVTHRSDTIDRERSGAA